MHNSMSFFKFPNSFQTFIIPIELAWVFCVRWSPSGDMLASSGEDLTAKLFDVKTGKEHCKGTMKTAGKSSWFKKDSYFLIRMCFVCLYDLSNDSTQNSIGGNATPEDFYDKFIECKGGKNNWLTTILWSYLIFTCCPQYFHIFLSREQNNNNSDNKQETSIITKTKKKFEKCLLYHTITKNYWTSNLLQFWDSIGIIISIMIVKEKIKDNLKVLRNVS